MKLQTVKIGEHIRFKKEATKKNPERLFTQNQVNHFKRLYHKVEILPLEKEKEKTVVATDEDQLK